MGLVDDGALEWNVPSPRLRVLRRYQVAASTLIAVVVAAGAALALPGGAQQPRACAAP